MDIETERLLLIPVTLSHAKDIFEYFTKEVAAYMFPQPASSQAETRKIVQQFVEQREISTDYVYAITLKETQEFLGLVGLHNLKHNTPELGIWTKMQAHGNHYGREAISGMLQLAKVLGFKKVCYPVDRRNIPSKKIPLSCGAKLLRPCKNIKTADGRILEEEIYEIPLQQ